jgi:hypothetical protein
VEGDASANALGPLTQSVEVALAVLPFGSTRNVQRQPLELVTQVRVTEVTGDGSKLFSLTLKQTSIEFRGLGHERQEL